jgi:hypothetical protein
MSNQNIETKISPLFTPVGQSQWNSFSERLASVLNGSHGQSVSQHVLMASIAETFGMSSIDFSNVNSQFMQGLRIASEENQNKINAHEELMKEEKSFRKYTNESTKYISQEALEVYVKLVYKILFGADNISQIGAETFIKKVKEINELEKTVFKAYSDKNYKQKTCDMDNEMEAFMMKIFPEFLPYSSDMNSVDHNITFKEHVVLVIAQDATLKIKQSLLNWQVKEALKDNLTETIRLTVDADINGACVNFTSLISKRTCAVIDERTRKMNEKS